MTIRLGLRRPSGFLSTFMPLREFRLPWSTMTRHARAMASSPAADGLTALALTVAKQVVAMGGRVVVLDGYQPPPGAAGVDRLREAFAATFAGMAHITDVAALPLLESMAAGEALEQDEPGVVFVSGVPAHTDQELGVSAAAGVLRRVVVNKLTGPLGDVNGPVVNAERTQLRPILLVLRAAPAGNFGAQCRAMNIAMLHLGGAGFEDEVIIANTGTALYVAQEENDARQRFVAMVEAGTSAATHGRQHPVEVFHLDASVLDCQCAPAAPEPALAPMPHMHLQIGKIVPQGRLGWLRRKKPFDLPWSEALSHLRIAASDASDAQVLALTLSLAQQVLAKNGRVILLDPLADTNEIGLFAAQFLHTYPGMHWIEEPRSLTLVADLFDEPVLDMHERIVVVSGEAATPKVHQEGEFGALALRPVMEVIRIATFAKMLRSLGATSPDVFAPVLLLLRHVTMDRRTALQMADLASANIVVVNIDTDPPVVSEEAPFGQTVIADFECAKAALRGRWRAYQSTVKTSRGEQVKIEFDDRALASATSLEAIRHRERQRRAMQAALADRRVPS